MATQWALRVLQLAVAAVEAQGFVTSRSLAKLKIGQRRLGSKDSGSPSHPAKHSFPNFDDQVDG